MATEKLIACPFCQFSTFLEPTILCHIEISHPEFPNPSSDIKNADDLMPTKNGIGFEHSINCNAARCGKILCPIENDSHDSMPHQKLNHFIDFCSKDLETKKDSGLKSSQTKAPRARYNLRNQDGVVSKKASLTGRHVGSSSIQDKNPSSSKLKSIPGNPLQTKAKRLGKSELGPHVFEAKMPEWLITLLTKEDGATKIVKRLIDGNLREVEICPNMVPGIISTLKPLISSDKSIQYAYLCHFSVKHVSKLKKEGGFCGYRNIQMMTSYIISAKSQGYEVFKNKVPSIFDIQDYIESAWDMGFNSYGRIETNGIRGTRKYIGTPEAHAMFCGLGIACDVQAIVGSRAEKKPAYETLFGTIEEYFRMYPVDSESKVRSTYLPPIYLQHSGHSMTVVGFERKKDGNQNLIVFDPKLYNSSKILENIDRTSKSDISSHSLLKPYRIDVNYLGRYNEFELLKLPALPKKLSQVSNS